MTLGCYNLTIKEQKKMGEKIYIKLENCWKKLVLKLIIKTPIKILIIINKNCLKAGDE